MADTAGTADASQQWLSEHHLPGYVPSEATTTAPAPLATALPGATFSNPPQWFADFLSGNAGGNGDRGPVVNEHTALNYAALYSCVSLIAGTVASLPLKVYRRRSDGGQDEATDRPEYDRLQVEFNPNTSAMSGRETGLGHLLTWGNSFCQIVRNRLPSRDVIRLQPLGPDIVGPDTNDKGELEYDIYDRQTGRIVDTLQRDEVLHVPGLSFDAMCGYSVVRVAKTILRAGMAQDREAERFVTRGIRPPGAIQFPQGKKFADEKQAMKFRETFKRLHSTEEGSLNVIILEDGATWESLGIDPVSAQLLESRKFSSQEIASIYHVPPHMVGLVEKVTSWGTGIEEMTIGFVVYTLLPILRRIEQEYTRKFFPAGSGFYVEHVLSGLLRGDSLKQAQAIQIYMNLGLLTVNEARRLLGWNPIDGGNVRYYPLSMGRVDDKGNDIPALATADPAGKAGGGTQGTQAKQLDKPQPAEPQSPDQRVNEPAVTPARDNVKLAGSLRKAIVGAAARCLRKEAAEVNKAARKPELFIGWIDGFFEKYAEQVTENVGPLVEAWVEAFGECRYSASGHIRRSKSDLLEAASCRPNELADVVEKVTQRWTSERLAEIGAELQPGEAVSG